MKLIMIAALAAAVATPVLAQTTAPATPTPDTTMQQPAPATPTADPAMTTPATPAADPATSAPAAPAPAAAPATDPSMAAPSAPATSDGTYPRCSRSVTDHCTERSNSRGQRLHSTPRPRR